MLNKSNIFVDTFVNDLDDALQGRFGIRKSKPIFCEIGTCLWFSRNNDATGTPRFIPNHVFFSLHLDPTKPKIRLRYVADEYIYCKKEIPDPFHESLKVSHTGVDIRKAEASYVMVK